MPRRICSSHSAPLFSIIIPTYNVENYIARCLESCINQTFSDIEILVVDDCGNDESIAIAQRYAKKDTRVRIIHNKRNLGTFQTRIQGILHARGTYTLFVDSDDYLSLSACSTLQNARADIVHFRAHYPANPQTSISSKIMHYTRYLLPTRFSSRTLDNEQIAQNFFLKSSQFPKFTLWDKCYKTSLLQAACRYFPESSFTPIVADDLLFFYVISLLGQSYESTRKRLYYYCLNAFSSMQNPAKKQRRIDSFIYVARELENLAPNFQQPIAHNIAKRFSSYLTALIILESRFDALPISLDSLKLLNADWGGGSTRQLGCPPSLSYSLALPARVHSLPKSLESLLDLCAHICLYPKLWESEALGPCPASFAAFSSLVFAPLASLVPFGLALDSSPAHSTQGRFYAA